MRLTSKQKSSVSKKKQPPQLNDDDEESPGATASQQAFDMDEANRCEKLGVLAFAATMGMMVLVLVGASMLFYGATATLRGQLADGSEGRVG